MDGTTQIARPPASADIVAFRAPLAAAGFTSHDRMLLAMWQGQGRRLVIEAASDGMPDYALIYQGDAPWARWGVARQAKDVLVWNCITHADLGRFATLAAALDALRRTAPLLPAPLRRSTNVILLGTVSPRLALQR